MIADGNTKFSSMIALWRWGGGGSKSKHSFHLSDPRCKKEKKITTRGVRGGEAVLFLSSQQAFGSRLSLCFSLSSTCLHLPPPSCHLFPGILKMKNPLSKTGFGPQLCELNQGLLFSCISQKRLLFRLSFSILDAHRISKVLLKITPIGGLPWTD